MDPLELNVEDQVLMETQERARKRQEFLNLLDTDPAIFDVDRCVRGLQSTSKLTELQETMTMVRREQQQLESTKRSIMAENYGSFVDATKHLRSLKTALDLASINLDQLIDAMQSERAILNS